jgi:hypothetical protein
MSFVIDESIRVTSSNVEGLRRRLRLLDSEFQKKLEESKLKITNDQDVDHIDCELPVVGTFKNGEKNNQNDINTKKKNNRQNKEKKIDNRQIKVAESERKDLRKSLRVFDKISSKNKRKPSQDVVRYDKHPVVEQSLFSFLGGSNIESVASKIENVIGNISEDNLNKSAEMFDILLSDFNLDELTKFKNGFVKFTDFTQSEKFYNSMSKFIDLIEETDNIKKVVCNNVAKLLVLTGLLGLGFYSYKKNALPAFFGILTVCGGIYTHGVISEMIQEFVKLSNFKKEDIVEQSANSDLVNVLITTFLSVVGKGTNLPTNLNELFHLTGEFARWSRKSKDLTEFLMKFVDLIKNLLQWIVSKVSPETLIFKPKANNFELTTWTSDVELIYDLMRKDEFQVNLRNADRVYSLFLKGLDLRKKKFSSRDDQSEYLNALNYYDRLLKKMLEPFYGISQSCGGIRPEPTTVMFTGPPGVGKTYINQHFAQSIIMETISKEEAIAFRNRTSDYIYNRNPETEYWDGYCGQYVCYYDEFGQKKEVAGGDSIFMEIIRASNSHPYMLHMADIESKGNKYFRSSFILGTSNLKKLNPTDLVEDPEAVRRRITFYYMVPKVEYCLLNSLTDNICDRRLDKTKLKAVLELDIYDIFECDYDDYYFIRPNLSTRMSYRECLDKVKAAHFVKQKKSEEYVKALYSEIEDFVDCTEKFSSEYNVEESLPKHSEHEKPYLEEVMFDPSFEPLVKKFFQSFLLKEKQRIFSMIASVYKTNFTNKCTFSAFIKRVIVSYDNHIKEFNFDSNELGIVDFTEFFVKTYDSSEISLIKTFEFVADGLLSMKRKLFKFYELSYDFAIRERKVVAPLLITAVPTVLMIFKTISYFKSPRVTELETSNVGVDHNDGIKNINVSNVEFSKKVRFETSDTTSLPGLSRGREMRVRTKVVNQGCSDINSSLVQKSLMDSSSYAIYVRMSNGTNQGMGTVHFIYKSCLLMPRHFVFTIENSPDDSTIRLQSLNLSNCNDFEFSKKEFLSRIRTDEDMFHRDLCFVDLVGLTRPFRNRLINLVSEKQIAGRNLVDISLIVVEPEGYGYHYGSAKFLDEYDVKYANGQSLLKTVVEYRLPTVSGDCGAPLFVVDKSLSDGKWLGIHVAGSQNFSLGISSVITREFILEKLIKFNIAILEVDTVTSQSGDLKRWNGINGNPFPFEHNFTIIGKVDKPVFRPHRSCIVKSKLWGKYFEAKKAPACLFSREHLGTLDDPLYIALKKYGSSKPILEEELVLLAVNSLKNKLFDTTFDNARLYSKKGVLSFDTAILGIVGDDLFKSIPRNTSAGYPYSQDFNGRAKFPFFGTDQSYDLSNTNCDKLRNIISDQIDQMKLGSLPAWYFTDLLKDELRPKEKVVNRKTRLFSGSPLDLTIITRMYFMDFCAFVQNNRIHNGVAIGIDAYSQEWNILAHYLKNKGDFMIAGDYSGFDTCQNSMVYYFILDEIIQPFYDDGDENYLIRKLIFDGLFKSKHIVGDILYQWDMNMVSGCPLTAVLNSFYSLILLRMAYICLAPSRIRAAHEYNIKIYDVAYGDDHVVSVSSDVLRFFNQYSIAKVMPVFGMVYTLEDKEAEILADSRSLGDVSFLKRKFRFEQLKGRYIAPLELDTVLEIPCWHKKTDDLEIFKEVFDSTLVELAMHEPEVFEFWSKKMLKACYEEYGYVPSITARKHLLEFI